MTKYKNYLNINEFFEKLNINSINYVVLRNYENMHEENFFSKGHEDIDLLVRDIDQFIDISGAIPKMWPEDKIHLVTFINGQAVPLDVRAEGDGYYDKKWQNAILSNRVQAANGPWFVMNLKDYYYSLAYHSILQKAALSEEYLSRLNDMASQLGMSCNTEQDHRQELDAFIISNGYSYSLPEDKSVCLRFHGREFAVSSTKRQRINRCILKNEVIEIGALLCKKIGIYEDVKRVLYFNDIHMVNDKIEDVKKLADEIQRKYGEDVYAQLAQRRIYNYLDKYNVEFELMYEHQRCRQILKKKNLDRPIFTMWWQGEDARPDVVKACNESLKKLGREVIILTEKNIDEYIDLPEYIWEKYREGIISNAHFSDIVRVAVLAMWGGVWIDSTVYIADDVPDYMMNKLFVFKQSPQLKEMRSYGNWWIAAPCGHEMILRQLSALIVYWKNEDKLLDYYIFHIIWKKNLDQNLHLKKEIEAIPTRITDSTHLLLKNYNKEFDENEWREFKAISPVFKCTYKWKGLNSLNTYYSRLCQDLLP